MVAACGSGGSSSESGGGSTGRVGGWAGAATDLTDADYDALTDEEKYAVSNKLMATLYKGLPAAEFFDVGQGLGTQVLREEANFVTEVRAKLAQPLVNRTLYLNRVDAEYVFDDRQRPLQIPLAMLFELPISSDFFDMWMAYKLANTILFSPSLELETCDYTDIQRVFGRLASMIAESRTIREIVYEHMISQENWRRFRSPEDNTREMMEIFLGRFRDDEVPKAALACQNWSLTDRPEGYQLVIGGDENAEPQEILDTVVTSCHEFYEAVADHPSLLPRITSVLVDLFLTRASAEEKEQMVDYILLNDPIRFEDIFGPILFSRAYLLNSERPKGFEEAFFNLAFRMDWHANVKFFKNINNQCGDSSYPSLNRMKQAPFTYKLGKPVEVPLDTLSFSYYHKAVREKLLIDRKSDDSNANDGGWRTGFVEVGLSGDDFIDYLFLSVLSRRATAEELGTLSQIIASREYDRDDKKVQQAMIVLDYLSRLSELYYLNAIN
jgi:hypothetical protein